MGHVYNLTSSRGRWFILLLKIAMMEMIMLAGVNSEDEMGAPDAGLLCISDCATCPVICSPPPPPIFQSSQPPPSHHSPPPQAYYHSPPPPTPPSPPPPPKSPLPSPQAPNTWYPIWGIPPPPGNFYNTPTGQGPPTKGPHDYPYPYYYFYASKASSLSLHASFLFSMVFFQVVYFFVAEELYMLSCSRDWLEGLL